jgi:hypothetical protein
MIHARKVIARGFGHLREQVGEVVSIVDRVRHARTLPNRTDKKDPARQ